jgi:hypothetical protein
MLRSKQQNYYLKRELKGTKNKKNRETKYFNAEIISKSRIRK